MRYDIIVVGAGSGGLNIASFMNKAGFKVLLIDKTDKDIGGDCLNYGCVPSKALIHVAKLVYDAKQARKFGLIAKGKPDMKKVANYIKEKKDIIRVHENAAYFRKRGMDVVLGKAKFGSPNSVIVNEKEYFGKKIVLATGSRPRILPIPGIEKVKLITNKEVFDLKKLPKKLLIIGAGPIGMEIGQAMNRLGSKVTVVEFLPKFLPKEIPEISKVLLNQLKKEGMEFYFSSTISRFTSSKTAIIKNKKGKKKKTSFDKVLMSVGRNINIEGLDLEKADIELDESGKKIKVDEYLRTTNKKVLLCGDVAGSYQFTHAAELHASIILNNFFSPFRVFPPFKKNVNYDNFSWVTYTYPEIANFGLNEKQLKQRGIQYEKLTLDFKDDDRAIVDDFREGKTVLYVAKERLMGGSMITPNAGEIFQELVLAKSSKLKLKQLFSRVYAYPTASRVNRKIISNYFAGRLTPFAKKILRILY